MDITSRGRSVVLSTMLIAIVLALLPPVAASAEAPPAPVGPTADGVPEGRIVPGRLLVGLGEGASADGLSTAVEALDGEIIEHLEGIDVHVVSVPEQAREQVAAALERRPGVVFVEDDAVVTVDSTRVPNDPRWPDQWSPKRTDAPSAWSVTVGSSSTVIAVIDTGVQSDHPDLKGGVLKGRNVIDGNSDTSDVNGHGTASAGVAAARTDNGIGVAGYCWNCSVLPVKAMDDEGNGTTTQIAQGIIWATDNGADIISMSLGGASGTTTLRNAVRYAHDRDVVLVAAAGNCGLLTDPCEAAEASAYPGAYEEVISVAGSMSSDARYAWSNYGSDVDLAAPGCNVSTVVGGGYGTYCGTSSATPVVAGIVGLMRSAFPDAGVDEIRVALNETSQPLSYVTHGRVEAAASLDAIGTTDDGSTNEPEETGAEDETDAPTTVVERIDGSDRFDTAVRVSKQAFPTGAQTVVLAYSHDFPDALSGATLAKKLGAPVLLTRGGDSLEKVVKDEITRLKSSRAVLLGGTSAISEKVATELKGSGLEVDRFAGGNRYDTAAKVAAEVLKDQNGTRRAYLVNGSTSWADAVAVSALAAQQGRPILLTTKDGLPTATLNALRDLDISELTIVGGEGVVAKAVFDAVAILGIDVRRPFAGVNRYDTSAKIANAAKSAGAEPARTWLATGRDPSFPDALAAGPAAAATGDILLLVDGTGLDGSKHTRDWLIDHADLLEHVRLVGGKGVITGGVRAEVEKIAGAK